MIELLKTLLVPRFALHAAPGAGAQDCAGSITVAEALKAEEERYAAQLNNDFAAMERLYADELVYVHSSTLEDTKASFIESMRSGRVKYRKMTRGDVKVRTYGGVAIISGRGTFEVSVQGEVKTLELLFHAIWAKRSNGAVQFISWQATKMN